MKRPKWLNKNIFALGLTSFFSDTSHEMTIAVLPTFLIGLVGKTLAPQFLGIISGVSDAVSTLASLISGAISDRVKKRKGIIVTGYATTGIFAGMIGLTGSWIGALVMRTLAWMGRGLREPPRDTLITESTKPEFYGRAFGFHRAMDTLGAIAGPLFVFFALSKVGVKNIFIISIIPGILATLTILFLTKEKHRETKNNQKSNFWENLRYLPREFKLFLLVMFIFGIGNFNKTLLLLRSQEVLTPTTGLVFATGFSVLLYAFRNGFQAVADYAVGHLSDILGRKILMAVLGFLLFGLVALGLAFPIASIWFFLILFALSGVSAATYTALEGAMAADLLPADLRGTGFGVLQTVDGIGDFVSSFMVGFLWSTVSPEAGFVYGVVLSIMSGLSLMCLYRR